MTRIQIIIALFFFFAGGVNAQEIITGQAAFEKQYQERIRKEVLNGVYIPADLEDAFRELERLTDPDMVLKFKGAPEDTIATKLHFSLGKWIIVNWGFYEGSRLSHALKQAGLSFPDDMAKFIIVSWHRKLNERDLNLEDQINKFRQIRQQEALNREKRKQVIKVEKRPGKNR